MLFSITIFGLSTIFGLLTFFGLVAIFDDVTTLGLTTIGDFSITILGVLIMFLVALTLKLLSKDFIPLLDTLFKVFCTLSYAIHVILFYLLYLFDFLSPFLL